MALVGMTSRLLAFDFEVQMGSYSLYYNILDDEEAVVELTYPGEPGAYWRGYAMPVGEIDVMGAVANDGVIYQVVGVGERAFSGCSQLTGIMLPSTMTDIGAYAFYQSGLRGIVTIPEGIVSIGKSAFYGCNSITEVRFNAVACESMGGSRSTTAFGGCRSLTKVTFGQHVRFIPDYAFVGMDLLRMEWAMPKDLEAVGDYAFAYCYSVYGTLVLPEGVKRVGSNAFAQCHSLFQLELPQRIERIDTRAFYQCINLRQVKAHALVPLALADNVFTGATSASLQVPCISVERYKAAEGWNGFRSVSAIQPCTLRLDAWPSNPAGGSVLGAGEYTVGSKVNLVAVCNAGYSFLGWTDGNNENPRTVVIDDTVSYRAVIEPADVVHEVEYVHDTTYMDGVEVVYEYYEINDVSVPLSSQAEISYNPAKRRIEVPFEQADIVSVALYNDAGMCVSTGLPKHGHINMRRMPSGYYIVRVTTFETDKALRFFHNKNK